MVKREIHLAQSNVAHRERPGVVPVTTAPRRRVEEAFEWRSRRRSWGGPQGFSLRRVFNFGDLAFVHAIFTDMPPYSVVPCKTSNGGCYGASHPRVARFAATRKGLSQPAASSSRLALPSVRDGRVGGGTLSRAWVPPPFHSTPPAAPPPPASPEASVQSLATQVASLVYCGSRSPPAALRLSVRDTSGLEAVSALRAIGESTQQESFEALRLVAHLSLASAITAEPLNVLPK